MAPTDREFVALTNRLEKIEGKLDALREEMAVRRGVDAVLRWMAGGGGLVGLLSAVATLWAHFHRGSG